MGKNKLARWNEFGSFVNVIQPEIAEVAGKDHPIKGNWNSHIFKNENPIILELGCGKGEYSIGMAGMFPQNNYIGVDIKGARMWRGAKTSNELNMSNVAFLRTRIEFINSFFSADEVDEIWITFPDPHPGARNANKRLTSPHFLKKYLTFLKYNGIIHLKTDNSELYNFTGSVVRDNNLELLFSTNDLYSDNLKSDKTFSQDNSIHIYSEPDRSFFRNILSIKTHYEKLFLRKGMKITYLSFRMKKENDFFSRVYDVTKLIPYGRVTSYGAIARFLGSGRSARMVGWALNVCHGRPEFIPAHRVVNRNGLLTGKHHFGNSSTMEQLLLNEGIIIEDDHIINFREKFWDPLTELQ